jgi:hypothetical protein
MLSGHLNHLLPTKAILASPFLAVLGGECVFQSTVFTLTSALAQEYVERWIAFSDFHHGKLTIPRASYFSYISSTSYVVSFLGPTLASFTMSRNLWLPFWINIVLLACAVPAINMLPGTEGGNVKTLASADSSDEAVERLLDEHDESPSRYSNAFDSHASVLQNIRQAVRKFSRLILGRRNFQVLLVSFFLTALASSDTRLLVQYISKRYQWTFAQAGYMLSAKAIVNFTLLAIVVPKIIKSSTNAVYRSEVRVFYIGAEISILVSVVGVLFVALALKFWMLLAGKHNRLHS